MRFLSGKIRMPNVFSGIISVFTILNINSSYNVDSLSISDNQAIQLDFQLVGKDMRVAMDKYKEGLMSHVK